MKTRLCVVVDENASAVGFIKEVKIAKSIALLVTRIEAREGGNEWSEGAF